MPTVYAVLVGAALFPLAVAWRANSATTLRHAILWAMAAWLAWSWALLGVDADELGMEPARYVAICLSGAAGIAVLGARRPYVFAWHFVVLGLVGVMVLPLLEHAVIGTSPIDPLRIFFVSATLAVGLLNYLPTRAAPAVVLLALAWVGELLGLFAPGVFGDPSEVQLFHLLVLLAPWAGWICWRRRREAPSEFDAVWLDFRDRFGLFWAQRVREQFNHAAGHAGWPVRFTWRGLHRTSPAAITPADQAAMLETLHKVLGRFMGPLAR
jgi:hypothetical protein